MSNDDEEPYSSIFASLKHPVRRKILRMLSKKPMSYSEMLEVLGVSNSFLTYHLENLGELVSKMQDGKYRLSSFGQDAMATMTRVEDIPATAPQQSPRTRPRNILARNVPIVLGIVCVLLIASLGGMVLYYSDALNNTQGELNTANKTISQLNATILEQNDAINQLNTTITNLEQIANLQESTVVLSNASAVLDTAANSSLPIILNNTETTQGIILPFNGSQVLSKVVVSYSGYIVVNISHSDSNSTSVELKYSSNGFNYDNTVNIGSTGSAYFPVLPTNTLDVSIGHNDTLYVEYNGPPLSSGPAIIPSAIVTMTYYY